MFYVISQSTDMRRPRTEIKKYRSESRAIEYANRNSGDFTYGDPDAARNHHRTFCDVYEVQGRIDRKDPVFKESGTSTYPRNENDNLARYIRENGEKVRF